MGRLLTLAQDLRAAGVAVVEIDGWATRGEGDIDSQVAVVHHTASARSGPIPSLRTVVDGRPDVDGPLCNVLLGRDAVAYVIASGTSNNAGEGSWHGVTGNRRTFGLEIENDGIGEPYPAAQMEAAVRIVAAWVKRCGRAVSDVCAHKEWAPTRKIDPSFAMDPFRARVRDRLGGEDDEDMRPTLERAQGQTSVWIVDPYRTSRRLVHSGDDFVRCCISAGVDPKSPTAVKDVDADWLKHIPIAGTPADTAKPKYVP